jgi:hypothetical protein
VVILNGARDDQRRCRRAEEGVHLGLSSIRQFVKSVIGESWYGNVRVKLVDQHSNSRMLGDLQRYVLPIESALLIDEHIESLTCRLPE